ncbi:MAG TPA: LLM class flavin-dependent oxidoreductase [Streptosporangiaceae bacterium]|nr:LLM class flavin-dependent oxidoreductase [Streptosporangiaceae bacterium]
MRLLTVGVGALPGEAQAMGVDFTARGRRADEAIDGLRLLWAGDEHGVSYSGEFFSFTSLCSFPKPWNTTTLPVHVGGSSPAAARRAGRRGDGYFPGGRLTAAQRASQVELMRAAAAEAGRDPAALEYTRWGSTGCPRPTSKPTPAMGRRGSSWVPAPLTRRNSARKSRHSRTGSSCRAASGLRRDRRRQPLARARQRDRPGRTVRCGR